MIDKKKLIALVGNTDKLFTDLLKEQKRSGEDYHQCILNLGYFEWQKPECKWDYLNMLEWVEKTYGPFARLMIQLGKYNQQVCNGGHSQYYFNGYASAGGGGCMTDHGDDLELHDWMAEKFEKLITPATEHPILDRTRILLKKFRVELDEERYHTETCEECGGSGTVAGEWDDESESYGEDEECGCCVRGKVEVDNENYGQLWNTEEWEKMDTDFYEFSDQLMSLLEQIVIEAVDLPKIEADAKA